MSKLILAFVLALGLGSSAFALPGLDGDNNPVPGAAISTYGQQP